MQLCDAWRLLHPYDRDYSFFSHPHNVYSRIDCIFNQHPMLDYLTKASIGDILYSDHTPVHCNLHLPHLPRRSFNWRLNEFLLSDALCLSELQSTTRHFISTHASDDTPKQIQWEALKCVLRGVLFKHGSRFKKGASTKLVKLLDELYDLETAHKAA